MTNPYVFSLKEKQKLRTATRDEIKAVTNRLQDNGYDGGVLEFGDGSLKVVAFNRNAVKSASGNNGEFSASNPKINRSFAAQTDGQKSTVSASRDRLIEAFGKSLVVQLENIGVQKLTE